MTDGQIALHGEGSYGQHAGIGCQLVQVTPQDAERQAELPRVSFPDTVQLGRQGWWREWNDLVTDKPVR